MGNASAIFKPPFFAQTSVFFTQSSVSTEILQGDSFFIQQKLTNEFEDWRDPPVFLLCRDFVNAAIFDTGIPDSSKVRSVKSLIIVTYHKIEERKNTDTLCSLRNADYRFDLNSNFRCIFSHF